MQAQYETFLYKSNAPAVGISIYNPYNSSRQPNLIHRNGEIEWTYLLR